MLFANKRDPRVTALEDSVETLQRQVRSLLMEWESTYNKLRAVVARLNKRDEREETARDVGAPPPSPDLRLVPHAVRGDLARRPPGPTERNY